MKAVEGWKDTTIGECLIILTDYTANGSFEGLKKNVTYFNEFEYAALVRTTDLAKQDFKAERFTDKRGYKYLKKTSLFGGEIVVANVGSVGKVYRVPKYDQPMTLAPNMYLLKFNQDISKPYIFQYLNSEYFKKGLLENIGSTTLQAINKDNLRNIRLSIPILKPEQTKIAEVLSTVDRAIEQTEALIAKQQRIKTGLMQDLLTRGIDEHGNLRSEQTHEFKDSPLGRIPVEWEVKYLMEIVVITEGQRDPKREPYRDWLLVAPDHIESKSGHLLAKKTAREQGAISGKYEFSCGDVVYSKIRPYLRKAVLVDFNGLCSADMYPLRPKDGVRSEFILTTILGERFSRYAESVSERSGFPKINRRELSEFQVALPSESEQNRMATLAKELSTSSVQNKTHLFKLRSLKTALMQDLLTGKKRVTPLLESEKEATA